MSDKIQMTEEQARQFSIDCFGGGENEIEANVDAIRDAGYIIKSAVEEAEEMYEDIATAMRPITIEEYTNLINKQQEAILELKAKLEEK